MKRNKKFMICEAPVSVGSPTRGSEDAYRHLKCSGLPELMGDAAEFLDYTGEKTVPEVLCDDRLRHLETVMAVNLENRKRVLAALEDGNIPVVLGGDHSLVMSSVASLAETVGAERVAVIYVDSHADINTEESTVTGMIHGMPLAAAMGLCTDALDVGKNKVNLLGKNTYIIGAHSIDEGEFPIIAEQGVHLYTADDVRRRGADDVVDEVLSATRGMKIHLSFDVDSINGDDFPATGYALKDSLRYDTVRRILGRIWNGADDVTSIDVVEYNPHIDSDGKCLKKMLDIFSIFKQSKNG